MGEWEISSGGRYRRLERGRLRGEEIDRQPGKALRKCQRKLKGMGRTVGE